MPSDKDGRPLVFTEPRRVLDGDWGLCTLGGEKFVVVAVGNNWGTMMVVYALGWRLYTNYSHL